jgi:hypothetical protein
MTGASPALRGNRPVRILAAGAAATVLALASGCDVLTSEGPLPLTATLQAHPLTTHTGQSVRFTAEGTGQALGALVLDFGDGGQEVNEVGGARRASLEMNWSYGEAGAYMAVLEVVELSGARTMDVVEITITDGPES